MAVYRYPVESYVLEFPAGLTEGLDPALCALKELKEETGYVATQENITFISPALCIDPWKSTESTTFVKIEVPENETNQNPVQELEDDELIEVELLSLDNLSQNIEEICQRKGYLLDSRLYLFAKGLADASEP